jgi:hypothetical protein
MAVELEVRPAVPRPLAMRVVLTQAARAVD